MPTNKEIILNAINELPDDISLEEIIERVNFISGVHQGLEQLDSGQGVSHERIKEEFSQWLIN